MSSFHPFAVFFFLPFAVFIFLCTVSFFLLSSFLFLLEQGRSVILSMLQPGQNGEGRYIYCFSKNHTLFPTILSTYLTLFLWLELVV